MVELATYRPEQGQMVHIETHQVMGGESPTLHLTENLSTEVVCHRPGELGQVRLDGDLGHVLAFDLCYEYPTTGDLIQMDELDPSSVHRITSDDIIRLRYHNEGIIEEVRFSLQKPKFISANTPRMQTTHRMRQSLWSDR